MSTSRSDLRARFIRDRTVPMGICNYMAIDS
jgi:hypothetical protein